ncbi:MAG: polyphosphate kinase 2 [Gammaproteobacteria bacterium]|nr:MAG: polyphosphate kinase 2 [Gammaproteobacteria bacterium]
MKKHKYEKQLKELAIELVEFQRWLVHTGKRVVVLFEGRDAAGKGGVIKAISAYLDTRHYRIVALSKPDERERTQWYFQRYIDHLPSSGEIVLFDRSWYNRAGVEHVMDFCSDVEYQRFLADCPVFEKQLADDGILLYKYWLAVDQAEQEQRFDERATDPLKRWKISPVDLAARDKYREYGHARDVMFTRTNTDYAPWHVVDFNDQQRGRLNLIRDLLDRLPARKLVPKPLKLLKLKNKPGIERLSDKSLWVKSVY